MRLLFVCTGNICRSPTAEGICYKKLSELGLATQVAVDSAGTHAFNEGAPADERAQEVALKHGIDLSNCRARVVTLDDFVRFDHLICMDWANMQYLQQRAPEGMSYKLSLLLDHVEEAESRSISDPYYQGERGFELVFAEISLGIDSLLRKLCTQ